MKRAAPGVLTLLCASLALLPREIAAADRYPSGSKAEPPKASNEPSASPAEAAGTRAAPGSRGHAIQWPGIDLPAYEPPESYSVDLVVQSPEGEMVMKRSIDRGRIRTEMEAEGHEIVMIELGDEKGTMYTVMPEQKRAVKMSTAGLKERSGMTAATGSEEAAAATGSEEATAATGSEEAAAAPSNVKIEDLGDDVLDGRTVKKLRISMSEGSSLGWFEKDTGAPVRLESTVEGKKSSMEWKNLKVGPQEAKQFEVPGDFEVMDMDQMMSQMKGMGGMASGMAGNYAGGMAQNFGQTMGSNLGGSLGGALGGPIGAIAGQYIGGKIGGMLGRKAADAVIPGR